MKIKSTKVLRSGQVKRYGDTVYSAEVETEGEGTDQEVWDLCQALSRSEHRKDGLRHDGACGFPFGLDSFGSLSKIADNRYIYTVTYPYCD